jgi:hypothetical protein
MSESLSKSPITASSPSSGRGTTAHEPRQAAAADAQAKEFEASQAAFGTTQATPCQSDTKTTPSRRSSWQARKTEKRMIDVGKANMAIQKQKIYPTKSWMPSSPT